jgi:putative oxidoreductase
MQAILSLIGRLLIAMIFILSGISKIGGYAGTVAHMESAGIPWAPLFLYGAVLIELGGGLMVATGFRARIGALVLALFLFPVTYFFHLKPAFDAMGNLADKGQLIQVMKNLAIIGGCLLVYGNGAGKLAIGKDS